MTNFAWGSAETKYFFELTPEKILDAVEASGLRCTGRVLTMNSMENRVYEVEIELDEAHVIKSPSEKFRVAKFYRPGRWTEAQILDEHQFLKDLTAAEIPAIAPLPFADGKTLHKLPDLDIYYTVFPKQGGRAPDELTESQAEQAGRLLARIHTVGKSRPADNRIRLTPATYGLENLKFLLSAKKISPDIEARYRGTVEAIVQKVTPWFEQTPLQRIHGDCHLGNLLWGSAGAFFLDFDDMVMGPCIQDFWLLLPDRVAQCRPILDRMIAGYEQLQDFDDRWLKLVEPLRALRLVHYSTWIAKRWNDPAFQRTFPDFGSPRYWAEQLADLEEQKALIIAT